MAKTQKAVLVENIGEPVTLGSRPIPTPGENQVLVKITATMILPHDSYGRDWGLLLDQKLPAVLGNNVAGTVTATSPGVRWQVGDKVFGISSSVPTSNDQCGLQEYAVLNANAIAAIPEGFSAEQVVTLPINLVTSAAALFTKTGFDVKAPWVQGGEYDYADAGVVIVGGGTNVGQFAVQLAKIAGIGKIVVVAGANNFGKLKEMGATHVIDRRGEDVARQIRDVVGGDGATMVYSCAPLDVDLVVDSISASKPSILKLLLPLEGEEGEQIKSKRPLCDAAFIDDLTNESLAPNASEFWAKVPQWLSEGKLLPTEHKVIDGLEKVDEINAALDEYREFNRAGAQTVVRI